MTTIGHQIEIARRELLTGGLAAAALAAEAGAGPGRSLPQSLSILEQGLQTMSGTSFVYITYIRGPAATVWDAFLNPKVQKRVWNDHILESDWREGRAWRMVSSDGQIANSGEVLEIHRPRRLALSYRSDHVAEWRSEGYSRAIFDLEAIGGATRFTVTHTMDRPNSKLITAASASWPLILSNLKSVIETGDVALTITASVLAQVRSTQ